MFELICDTIAITLGDGATKSSLLQRNTAVCDDCTLPYFSIGIFLTRLVYDIRDKQTGNGGRMSDGSCLIFYSWVAFVGKV